MKHRHFLYIAPLIAFLFSCEKVIEFKGDEVETKLVLNGILTPDSVVKVQLTESRFFLDNSRLFNKINRAEVTLWKDGEQIESLQHTGEGYYTGTYITREGDNLRITASCPGFDPVECETRIVSATPVTAVDTVNFKIEKRYIYEYDYDTGYWTIIDSSRYTAVINTDMNITFNDPAGTANYYTVSLYLSTRFSTGYVSEFPIYYKSGDMVFQTNNENPFEDDVDMIKASSYLFSDDLFDGKEYKLRIKTDNNSGFIYEPEEDSFEIVSQEIRVELQSLSPSYYLYLKTREAGYDSDFEFFTEPVQVYSNINGGIGIFCSYANATYGIPLRNAKE